MNRVHKRIAEIAIAFLLICAYLVMPLTTYADSKTDKKKVVKVAYLLSPGYQEGAEGEYKTGQGYEYLQKIASYTGWSYEYVYGNFSELIQKLANGEIDLMGNLSYIDERAKNFSYGKYEQGKESFFLYVNGTESEISANDYSTINGKRIGVSAGSYQEKLWENWCENYNISCDVVEFTSLEERQNALNNGLIDGTLGSYMTSETEVTKNWVSILKFGDSPFYFGVNKNRPDLLEDLNNAQEMILDENPYYNDELSTKYVKNGILNRTQLKDLEVAWLKEHNGKIRVGCLANYLPLSNVNDGDIKGVIPDLLAAIENNYLEYNVYFEFKAYSNYNQMVEDLKNGNIDLAAPIYGDYWKADKEGISLTNSFMSTSMLLLNKGKFVPENVKTIGIDKQSPIQEIYAEIYYPEYELVMYSSMKDVAKAVINGEVDVALSSSCCYHLSAIQDSNLKNLNRVTLPENVDMVMAVSKQNPELIAFMNRAISMVGDAQIFNSLAVNSNFEKRTTLADYVSENPIMAMIISSVIIIGLLIIIIRLKKAIQRSRIDLMTGLLNKTAMQEYIKKDINHGGVLFMIDIDNFKQVNDVLGHEMGDKVIKYFASNLKIIFNSDDIIGRFGGDEFMVFIPKMKCDQNQISDKVEQMQRVLRTCEPLEKSKTVKCSVSVGVLAIASNESITFEKAFEKVDAALYEAKKRGKSTYAIAE